MSKPEVVIPSKTIIVHDAVLGIDRQVVAGQPVPPDLVEAYKAEIAGDSSPPAISATGDELDGLSPEELKERAAALGLEVEGTGQGGRVVKADLIAALKAAEITP